MTTPERMSISRSEYDQRIKNIQKAMIEQQVDVLVTHACECESANVRYLTNFWAVFDFVGVVIPREGNPILLTGGPESYDFSVMIARLDDIRVNPLYVETSAPEWDKPTNQIDFTMLLDEFRQKFPVKRIGICNENIIPNVIIKDIEKGLKDAQLVSAGDLIMKVRWFKTENEINCLRKAYEITVESMKKTVEMIRPGLREWEIEAEWRANAYKMGAEGTAFPIWVTSGPNCYQSLSKSTERIICDNEMVQLTFGAKYNGYCSVVCRPVVIGEIPQRHKDMIRVAVDCVNETIDAMKPGVPFASIYNTFQARLTKEGFSGLNLYGPAHGTGMQECEGPWVDNRTDLVLQPNMAFNVDIWISDEEFGVRIEDGVAITDTGVEQFSSWNRGIIQK